MNLVTRVAELKGTILICRPRCRAVNRQESVFLSGNGDRGTRPNSIANDGRRHRCATGYENNCSHYDNGVSERELHINCLVEGSAQSEYPIASFPADRLWHAPRCPSKD